MLQINFCTAANDTVPVVSLSVQPAMSQITEGESTNVCVEVNSTLEANRSVEVELECNGPSNGMHEL